MGRQWGVGVSGRGREPKERPHEESLWENVSGKDLFRQNQNI